MFLWSIWHSNQNKNLHQSYPSSRWCRLYESWRSVRDSSLHTKRTVSRLSLNCSISKLFVSCYWIWCISNYTLDILWLGPITGQNVREYAYLWYLFSNIFYELSCDLFDLSASSLEFQSWLIIIIMLVWRQGDCFSHAIMLWCMVIISFFDVQWQHPNNHHPDTRSHQVPTITISKLPSAFKM